MVTNHVKMIAAGFVASVALATPATGAAQSYRYADAGAPNARTVRVGVVDVEPAVVVECAPGQRAVMAQRRVNGSTQVVARCEGTAQEARSRRVSRSNARYVERASAGVPTRRTLRHGVVERTKTKTALMIAGSAATGAGVGGAVKGKKGAIIGAAIGGGSASIYEAAKRR